MEQEEEGRRGQGKAGKGAALKNPDYQPYNQLAKGIPLLPVCLLLISGNITEMQTLEPVLD